MNNFLTSRQVQDILKVDRITIYRMIQDGRLKGVKIGQQWRFSSDEVDNLLHGEKVTPSLSINLQETSLPIHCMATIQSLLSDVSQVTAVIINTEGVALTPTSNPCKFCRLIRETPVGKDACQTSWKSFFLQSQKGERHFTCHAGLNVVGSPIIDHSGPIGLFLIGEFFWEPVSEKKREDLIRIIASRYQVSQTSLEEAFRLIPIVGSDKKEQYEKWSVTASNAIQSVLQERAGFLQRLQQIANLTQIS